MIICNDWGLHLRWGNYGIAYLFLMSLCLETGHELSLPDYYVWKYLKHPPKIVSRGLKYDEMLNIHRYTPEQKETLVAHLRSSPDKVFNLCIGSCAHLQTELWWCSDKKTVFRGIELHEQAIQAVAQKYSSLLEKQLIGIGIRRGDFVNHGDFYQIPMCWYELALNTVFPDWK